MKEETIVRKAIVRKERNNKEETVIRKEKEED